MKKTIDNLIAEFIVKYSAFLPQPQELTVHSLVRYYLYATGYSYKHMTNFPCKLFSKKGLQYGCEGCSYYKVNAYTCALNPTIIAAFKVLQFEMYQYMMRKFTVMLKTGDL